MNKIDDEFVFISHSLGSRITVDALQRLPNIISNISKLDDAPAENMQNFQSTAVTPLQTNTKSNFLKKKRLLQQKEFTVFMLSNQLPLLQMGQLKPGVTERIAEICSPEATHEAEKLFSKTHLIAFSDPNDLFSYALPPNFINEYMDSRLCPILTNAILNVTSITDIFVGQFANPVAAHTEYDNDPRVIGLIAKGIGHNDIDSRVDEHCIWLESVPDSQ